MTQPTSTLTVLVCFIIALHFRAKNCHETSVRRALASSSQSSNRVPLVPLTYTADDAYNNHLVSDETTEDGLGFLNFREKGAFAEWLIPITTSGGYEVTIGYYSDHWDRPADLQVAGKLVSYAMPQSPSWATTWATESHMVELGGSPRPTTFRLIAVGTNGPNIGLIDIEKKYDLLGYTNHLAYAGSQWHIQRVAVPSQAANAEGQGPSTLLIQYEVYKGITLDQIRVEIYALDCFTNATGILSSEMVMLPHLPASDPDLRILQTRVHVNMENFQSSNIWTSSDATNHTTGTIQFCARVTLFSNSFDPPQAESFVESMVTQHIELSASFHLENIGVTQIRDRFVEIPEDAHIRYPISVCPCTNTRSGTECMPNPVTVHINSNLQVCLQANSAQVEIRRVVDMTLRQDDPAHPGGLLVYQIIENSEPKIPALTQVSLNRDSASTLQAGSVASVRTRLLTSFFGGEGTPTRQILVSGHVALGPVVDRRESRRLRSVRMLEGYNGGGDDMFDEPFEAIMEVNISGASQPRVTILDPILGATFFCFLMTTVLL